MEKRFRFISPIPDELALYRKGKVLLPLSVVAWLALNLCTWPIPELKLGVGIIGSLFILWLNFRLNDIQRRDAQSKYGSVELTPRELRISISERSLLRIRWHDFTGTEVKNGILHIHHLEAQIEQDGQTQRLDRVRLNQLEDPDGLIEALRVQTAALNYLKQ